jgi:Flp pilus assembly protein TadD
VAGDYDSAIAECRTEMTAGRISHAVTACRQAADARPRSSEALTLLAEAEFTRGHTGVALKLATQATNANQNFADAYVIIGGVYQEKGRNAEARAAYEQYLALQPKGKHAADLRAIIGSL